jgi:predicted aldo/keto reductase-like oxidoreductase
LEIKKRRLGRTNMMVTELGLGAMDTPQAGEGLEVVQLALKLGINFIDTARDYDGSEYLIGEVVRETEDKDFYIATKTFSRTRDGSQYDVDRSLNVLGVNRVDLYQLHDVSSIESWEQVLSEDGALEGLRIAQIRGLVNYIGISSHKIEILEKAISSERFDTVMLEYSAFYPDTLRLIKMAKDVDVGVIVMRPLGGSGRTSSIRNKMSAANISLTPEMLLKYVLSNTDISVAIPGTRFPDRVRRNVDVAKSYQHINEQQKKMCENAASQLWVT